MINFFKVSIFKIVSLVVILLLTYFIPHVGYIGGFKPDGTLVKNQVEIWGIGYPVFYGEQAMGDIIQVQFDPYLFVVNILLYYFAVCILAYFYKIMFAKKYGVYS